MPMPSIAAGIHAVKEINASVHCLQDIRRSTYSHQICRLVRRKIRHDRIQDPVHLFVGLPHGKPADRITVKPKLRNLLCVADTDIFIDPPLVDPK